MSQTANQSAPAAFSLGRLILVIALAVVAAAALALPAWYVLTRTENGSSSDRAKPVATSVEELQALPDSVGHAVYWAGRRSANTYELTRTRRGDIYIRYLPPGVSVGDKRPNFLTVGTYPQADAFRAVQKAATKKGEIVRSIPDGGLAVGSPKRPQSVYFAYPRSDLLVEVYDSSPKRALRAVVSGQVQPLR